MCCGNFCLFSVHSHNILFFVCEKASCGCKTEIQNVVNTYILRGDDLGWGAPGLGDDLGWGGEATCGAQGCGGGSPPLELLVRDIKCVLHYIEFGHLSIQ